MLHRIFKAFRSARDGNIMLISALGLSAIVLVSAGAMDYAKVYAVKRDSQTAMDGAILSLVRNYSADMDFQTEGERLFRINLEPSQQVLQTAFTESGGQIDGAATLEVPTLLLGLILEEAKSVNVQASATAQSATPIMEIALVFDVSSSMTFDEAGNSPSESGLPSRFANAQTAAVQFVQTLASEVSQPENVYLSVVPYGNSVGIAPAHYGGLLSALSVGGTAAPWTSPPTMLGASERFGASNYDDTAPETEPVAFYHPNDAIPYGGSATPMSSYIPMTAPLPLTNNHSAVETYLNALVVSGNTGGHIGFEWGWYSISPNWRNFWNLGHGGPKPYDEAIKSIIIFSDGMFNHNSRGDAFSTLEPLGLNQYFLNYCANARAAGVILYTASYISGDSATLQSCAGDPAFFFNAQTGAQLLDAFNTSATGLAEGAKGAVRLIQ